MDTYAVYLRPRGSLAAELGSDTLFGAVCWAIRVLGLSDVGALLEGFEENPRFAFSSAFPFLQVNGNRVRFYPRPCLPELSPGQIEALAREEQERNPRLDMKAARVRVVEQAKRLSEKEYLSEALFGQVIHGETDAADIFRRFRVRGHAPQDIEAAGTVLISWEERRRLQSEPLEKFIDEADVQHNQVDRVAGATAEGLLFFERETFFRPGAGLWCVLRAEPEDVERLIRPALRYLADTGLGANRTAGKGHFDIEIGGQVNLPQAENPNAFVVLSRYLPQEGEWRADGEPLSYQLLHLWPKRESKFVRPVAGQATAPVYKRRVRLFAPGSIFPLQETRPLYGRLAELVPAGEGGHTVWQSGLAVPVLARIGLQSGGA